MNGDIGMTPAIAKKLHNWGGISTDQWLRLQVTHDQWIQRRNARTNETHFQNAA
jgi:plasmid maintenance system antidote protein VapI